MGHMDLQRHLHATWHKQGLEVACSADDRPYKNFYAYYVRRHMPELQMGRAALKSNLSFGRILKLPPGSITGVAKQVFRALGTAPTIRPCSRYGSNLTSPFDHGPGVTGVRSTGAVLYRCPPKGEPPMSMHGLRPKAWRPPTAARPDAELLALRLVLDGHEAVGHMWACEEWAAALYREWVKLRRTDHTTPKTLELTALWSMAIGEHHSGLSFTHARETSRSIGSVETNPTVVAASRAKAHIIRHGKGEATTPAIEASGAAATPARHQGDQRSAPTTTCCQAGIRE